MPKVQGVSFAMFLYTEDEDETLMKNHINSKNYVYKEKILLTGQTLQNTTIRLIMSDITVSLNADNNAYLHSTIRIANLSSKIQISPVPITFPLRIILNNSPARCFSTTKAP